MAAYSSSNGFRTGSKTPVSILQELLLRNNIVPHYELIHNGVGTHEPQFRYKLQAGEFVAIGSGKSKKEAKHDAARNVLKRMHYNKALTESAHVEPEEDIDVESPYTGAVKENLVGQLTDLCIINNLPPPEYVPVREEGPPHARLFTYKCVVSTRTETAIARTKKQAKHMVSQQMINRLADILGDKMVLVPEKAIDPETNEPDATPLLMLEGVKRNHLNLGLPLSQYHTVISQDVDTTPTLEYLKEKSPSWIKSHDNPESLVKKIVSELKVTYSIMLLKTRPPGERSDSSDDDDPNEDLYYNLSEEIDKTFKRDKDSKGNKQKESQKKKKPGENNTGRGGRKPNQKDNKQANKKPQKPPMTTDSNKVESAVHLIMNIDSSPPRSFFGKGSSEEEAVRNASVNALLFYFLMSQTVKEGATYDWLKDLY